MENKSLKNKLVRYIDAGFPIIYINTFEEDKVDSLIPEISSGKEVYEWNETNGYIDFETKAPIQEDCSLEQMLDQLKVADLLDRKIILLKDINDSLEDAKKLIKLIKGMNCYVNLIPMNSTVNEFTRSTKEKMNAFYETLIKNNINVTLRREQGHDIDAACGQLRIKKMQGEICKD